MTDEAAFTSRDWGLLSTIALIWGSSFLFIAVALETVEPGLITWGRVGLGAVVLNVVPKSRLAFDPQDRWRMVVLSILWVGIPFTLFPIAEQYINSAVTGMLNGGTPIFAAIVVAIVHRRLPTRIQMVGLAVGLAGVILISLSQSGDGSNAWIGVVLVVGATVCYGIAVTLAAPLQQRYGSLPLMARMLALAALWTAPFGLWSIPGSSFAVGPALSIIAIGAFGTGLAFVIMGTLVGSVGSTRASLVTYLIPVVALGLGVLVRDDHVTALGGAGVALVVVGAVLAARAPARLPMT